MKRARRKALALYCGASLRCFSRYCFAGACIGSNLAFAECTGREHCTEDPHHKTVGKDDSAVYYE